MTFRWKVGYNSAASGSYLCIQRVNHCLPGRCKKCWNPCGHLPWRITFNCDPVDGTSPREGFSWVELLHLQVPVTRYPGKKIRAERKFPFCVVVNYRFRPLYVCVLQVPFSLLSLPLPLKSTREVHTALRQSLLTGKKEQGRIVLSFKMGHWLFLFLHLIIRVKRLLPLNLK